MKTYVDYSHYAQEFSIDATLTIREDGHFSYDETWSSYGAAIGGSANGIWWKDSDTLFFRCDYSGGALYLGWTQGETMKAIDQTDEIDFGNGFTMSLINEEPVQSAPPPKKEEVINQDAANKKPRPTIARLHFKDGRIVEKQLPRDPLFSLFDEMYYRLVDENGEETNVFKPRPNSEASDSRAIKYDEI